MRINLLAVGSRGEVQPLLALGVGLKIAGFKVTLVSFEEFRSLVSNHGLEFISLSGDVQEFLNQNPGKKTFTGTSLSEIIKLFRNTYIQMFEELWEINQSCDLLISNAVTGLAAEPIAEKLGIPLIETSVFPGWPTRAFPSFFGPWPPSFGERSPELAGGIKGAINWFSYQPASWMVAIGIKPIIKNLRREILGLSGKPDRLLKEKPAPFLAGFSKHILPQPPDWPKYVHPTGYWFLDTPGYQPQPALQEFLDAGKPPVYIGFGSMPSQDPQETTSLVIQALALADQRGILFTGHETLGFGMAKQPSDYPILYIDPIPHDWLFPRTAAVVHHGGAGTTAAGIRAGRPSVLVPVGGDQPFWAFRIEKLGLGPPAIPRSRLTAENLAQAIHQAVTDQEILHNATALAKKIQAEDGVGQAVQIINRFLNLEN